VTRRPAITLAAVFALALLLRLIALWQLHHLGFFSVRLSDALVYETRASAIAAGDWLGPPDFMHAPLYACVLAAIKALGGTGDWAPRLFQCVLSSFACILLARAAARWINPRCALPAAILLALCPTDIFACTIIQKTTLTTFLSVLTLWLWARARDHRTSIGAALVGAALALLTLDRQNALVLAPLMLLTLGYRNAASAGSEPARQSDAALPKPLAQARGSLRALAFSLAFALTLSPWIIRHKLVLHDWFLAGPNLGQNLDMGNRADATGTYLRPARDAGVGEKEQAAWTRIAAEALGGERQPTPREVSDWFLARTLKWVRDNPAAFLTLTWKKTLMLLGSYEWPDLEDYYLSVEHSRVLGWLDPALHWGVLLPTACAGLVFAWPLRRRWWPLAAWSLIIGASIVAFVIFGRYRAPLLPVVLMFAAAAIAEVPTIIRENLNHRARVSLALAPSLAGALLCNLYASWPRAPRQFSYSNHALALAEAGRAAEALTEVDRALGLAPADVDALTAKGSILHDLGRHDEALAAYNAALAGDPAYTAALRGAALALINLDRLPDAEQRCRAALAIDPRDAVALTQLGTILARTGRLSEAIRTLTDATAADPRSTDAFINLGNAYLAAQRTEPARGAYEHALTLDPENPDAHHNLGVLLAGAADWPAAAEHFQRVIKHHPDRRDSEHALLECWLQSGQAARAAEHIRRAIADHPGRQDLKPYLDRASP